MLKVAAENSEVVESFSENDSDNSEENVEPVETLTEGGNLGWANSLAKVLKTTKPKAKKTLVLSRAKRYKTVEEGPKAYDFQIANEIKEEKPTEEKLAADLAKSDGKKQTISLRVKPSLMDRERERKLKKVATKGVVQLFNAVRMQQKEIEQDLEQAGRLDHRRDAVLSNINKRKFLDVLMGGSRAQSEAIDNPVKREKMLKDEEDSEEEENEGSSKKSQWSVLRDDFMTDKKVKHWDEEDESSDGGEEGFSSDNSE